MFCFAGLKPGLAAAVWRLRRALQRDLKAADKE